MCVPGARGCWGRASDPLGLELHMVGSHHVGLGPEPSPLSLINTKQMSSCSMGTLKD